MQFKHEPTTPATARADDASGSGGTQQSAASAAGAAAGRGRATLGVLACVCRDLRDFGAGLQGALEAAAAAAACASGSGAQGPDSSGGGGGEELATALRDGLAEAVDAALAARRGALAAALGRCLGEAFHVRAPAAASAKDWHAH